MFEVNFGGEQAAGPVGQLDGQSPSQHARCHQVGGYGGQSKPMSRGAVHPVSEPLVANGEGEPAEEQASELRIVVELFGEFDRPDDGFDHHPLVCGSTQRLPFDDLAGQPVAGQAAAEVFSWLASRRNGLAVLTWARTASICGRS
jgi:hypothetical protein